jgi:hypothetical protein
MSKTKERPKEASRVKKSSEHMVRGYCQRDNCTEWATYHVFDRRYGKLGAYCRDCSETLVSILNRQPADIVDRVDVQSMFPPL